MKASVKLRDVCDVRDGTHDSPKYVGEGYPLITSKNVTNGFIDISEVNYISKEDYEKINQRSFVDDGDIIMPMIGTIGNPIVVAKQFEFAVKNVALIKFKNKTPNNYFIKYLLCSRCFVEYIKRKNRGGTQKFISLNDIRNFEFVLPPQDVQRSIVDTLDKASKLIVLGKQQLEELDNLIKAVFHDMFGDPVTNDKNWGVLKLGDISSLVSSGSTPKGGASVYSKHGYIFIRSQNVIMNSLDFSDVAYINENIHNSMKRTWVKHNDMLLNITGASIGRTAVFKGKDNSANVNQHVCIIRLLDTCVPEFVSFLVSMPSYQLHILSQQSGATRQAFNFEQIKAFNIPLPPLSLQKQFAAIVEKIEEQKALVQKMLNESQYLFDSLMDKYFGE